MGNNIEKSNTFTAYDDFRKILTKRVLYNSNIKKKKKLKLYNYGDPSVNIVLGFVFVHCSHFYVLYCKRS